MRRRKISSVYFAPCMLGEGLIPLKWLVDGFFNYKKIMNFPNGSSQWNQGVLDLSLAFAFLTDLKFSVTLEVELSRCLPLLKEYSLWFVKVSQWGNLIWEFFSSLNTSYCSKWIFGWSWGLSVCLYHYKENLTLWGWGVKAGLKLNPAVPSQLHSCFPWQFSLGFCVVWQQ